MSQYTLSIDGKNYSVHKDVYNYVIQLEMYVKFPKDSKLLEKYKHLKNTS